MAEHNLNSDAQWNEREIDRADPARFSGIVSRALSEGECDFSMHVHFCVIPECV